MRRPAAAKAAGVPVATVTTSPPSSMLPLVLGIALGLSLMIVGVAFAPAWAMRESFAVVVEDRRETLLYTGVAVWLAVGLGLGISLVLS